MNRKFNTESLASLTKKIADLYIDKMDGSASERRNEPVFAWDDKECKTYLIRDIYVGEHNQLILSIVSQEDFLESTCPDCLHARHTMMFCPNMASDNDCDCSAGVNPERLAEIIELRSRDMKRRK